MSDKSQDMPICSSVDDTGHKQKRVANAMEAFLRKSTPMRAIRAKCWDCQGGNADPALTWRIGNCEVGDACPLYEYRPYRRLFGSDMPKTLKAALNS